MTRISKREIEDSIVRLNARLPNMEYELSGQLGGWKLTSHGGSRVVAPAAHRPLAETALVVTGMNASLNALSKSITDEMMDWLHDCISDSGRDEIGDRLNGILDHLKGLT